MRENLTRLISEGYQRQPPAFLMKGIQDLIPQAGKLTQGASGVQTDLQALLTNFDTEISAIGGQLSGRRMSPNAKIKLEGQLSALMQSRNLVRRELDGFDASTAKLAQSALATRAGAAGEVVAGGLSAGAERAAEEGGLPEWAQNTAAVAAPVAAAGGVVAAARGAQALGRVSPAGAAVRGVKAAVAP